MPEAEIHSSALPNSLSPLELRLRSDADGSVHVDPARAGWRYLSFRVLAVSDRFSERLDPGLEHAVVMLAGGDARLDWRGGSSVLTGRSSPFESLPSAWYVPVGSDACIHAVPSARAHATLVAIATAPPSGRSGVANAPRTITPADVKVEVRGAGNATRQINHIIAPDFPADRLEIVEVLTPSGNWSSWPPHKHDVDDMPTEAVLEEVYYYRFARPNAWGIQRLYRADRSRDATWEVRSGDVVLVTDGYHPFVAAHGDDAYYLNALAGDHRTMACSFDPDLAWVRESWPSQTIDRRLPLVRAAQANEPADVGAGSG